MTLRSITLTLAALTFMASGYPAIAASKVAKLCEADFHKLCPDAKPGRGAVMRCVKTQTAALTPDCKSAVDSAKAASAARKAAKAAAKASAKPMPAAG